MDLCRKKWRAEQKMNENLPKKKTLIEEEIREDDNRFEYSKKRDNRRNSKEMQRERRNM